MQPIKSISIRKVFLEEVASSLARHSSPVIVFCALCFPTWFFFSSYLTIWKWFLFCTHLGRAQWLDSKATTPRWGCRQGRKPRTWRKQKQLPRVLVVFLRALPFTAGWKKASCSPSIDNWQFCWLSNCSFGSLFGWSTATLSQWVHCLGPYCLRPHSSQPCCKVWASAPDTRRVWNASFPDTGAPILGIFCFSYSSGNVV